MHGMSGSPGEDWKQTIAETAAHRELPEAAYMWTTEQ